MNRSFVGICAIAALLWPLAARAATVPAIESFDHAFSKVNDYTATVRAHEVQGDRVQDRTYEYWFKRPTLAKTQIVSGDGKGGGGVWNGGDKVSGHQGGILSFFHLKVGLHDGRATSLRGYTIPDGLLQNEVDKYKTISGRLSQRDGPVVDGMPTDEIELQLAEPSQYGGVTRMVMDLSKETHFPVRQIRFSGDKIVAEETFSDVKTNVGLRDSDFPF